MASINPARKRRQQFDWQEVKRVSFDLKELVPVVSGSALLFGVLLQAFSLTQYKSLQFFSFNQVINDAIGLGGLLAAFACLTIVIQNKLGSRAQRNYSRFLYVLSGIPLVILILSYHNFIDLWFTSFEYIVMLFLLLAAFVQGLWAVLRNLSLTWEAFQVRHQSKWAKRWLNPSPGRVFLNLGKLTCLGMLGIYAITMANEYYMRHYLAIVKRKGGDLYVVNYMNDGYAFAQIAPALTVVIPRGEIETYLTPYSLFDFGRGLAVIRPDTQTLEMAFGRSDIKIVKPLMPLIDLPPDNRPE